MNKDTNTWKQKKCYWVQTQADYTTRFREILTFCFGLFFNFFFVFHFKYKCTYQLRNSVSGREMFNCDKFHTFFSKSTFGFFLSFSVWSLNFWTLLIQFVDILSLWLQFKSINYLMNIKFNIHFLKEFLSFNVLFLFYSFKSTQRQNITIEQRHKTNDQKYKTF